MADPPRTLFLVDLVNAALSRPPLPPCDTCGSIPLACTLCEAPCRHFLVVKRHGRSTELHLCDLCAQPYLGAEPDSDLPDGYEMGAYAPKDDCVGCDTWG